MNSITRVAWPKQIGSTPVAYGSRVPACPTRRSPVSRRTRETSWKLVFPGGLRMLRIPSMLNLVHLAILGQLNKLQNARTLFDAVVAAETQRWNST
jgi:hypothetical protein